MMKKSTSIVTALVVMLLVYTGNSGAQQITDLERGNWLLGVVFKLQGMRDDALADIQRYETGIRKADNIIMRSENLMGLARQKGNEKAEMIAGSALTKARQAKLKNEELKNSAVLRKKRVEDVLTYAKTEDSGLETKLEKVEFDNNRTDWMEKQKQLIEQRLIVPNKWCSGIQASLMGEVPPLPYKKFNELQAGDVLLIGGGGLITAGDNLLSGEKVSSSSHTVSYLKEVNGKKLFLDSQPRKGPRIISEEEFLEEYAHRGAEVARLVGQPLNENQAKQLFSAAVKMDQENRKKIADSGFDTTLSKVVNPMPYYLFSDSTNYGAWGKDNVVCSETGWALLKAADQKIPKSGDQAKVGLGIDFSPADYLNQKYFLVTPLAMPKQFTKKK